MLRRKLTIVVMALALVLPPLSGLVMHALGMDDSHAHFDHVWHQPSMIDHVKLHDDGSSSKQTAQQDPGSNTNVDHVHMTVMAMAGNYVFEIADLGSTYGAVTDLSRSGRDFSPPGRPPQSIS